MRLFKKIRTTRHTKGQDTKYCFINIYSLRLGEFVFNNCLFEQPLIFPGRNITLLFQPVTQKIEYPPEPNRQYVGESAKDLTIEGKTKIEYQLKTGDVLGIIAEEYNVKVSDLKYWNNIYDERRIRAGQKINIFVPDDRADYYTSLDETDAEKTDSKENMEKQILQSSALSVLEPVNPQNKVEHVVKSGESPYVIAKLYEGVTPEMILEWNHIDNPRKIQIGQKLILYPKR